MTTNELEQIGNLIDASFASSHVPFWKDPGYLIGAAIGIIGLVFSWKAFIEARQAKHAAREAGKTVKIQTITIDLTEIVQKLDELELNIRFEDARNLLNEITRKLHRIVAPFARDLALKDKIGEVLEALAKAKESLNSVRPTDSVQAEVPRAVYNAVEGDFATINTTVAGLLGLFEEKTNRFGDDHGNT